MPHVSIVSPIPAPAGVQAPRFDISGRVTPTARAMLLWTAGTLPVLAIPLFVFGAIPMTESSRYLVFPLSVAALFIMLNRSPEAAWARHGFVAGLLAVAAYDGIRIPMVVTGIWPDFIPRLGSWILGDDSPNVLVGYLWRYLGDGGGIGLAFFTVCGLISRTNVVVGGVPATFILHRRPVQLSVMYGVFIWSGLVATVGLSDRGSDLLFALTPTSLGLSLLGHLVYGAVLGVFLRRVVRPRAIRAAAPVHAPGDQRTDRVLGEQPRGAAVARPQSRVA